MFTIGFGGTNSLFWAHLATHVAKYSLWRRYITWAWFLWLSIASEKSTCGDSDPVSSTYQKPGWETSRENVFIFLHLWSLLLELKLCVDEKKWNNYDALCDINNSVVLKKAKISSAIKIYIVTNKSLFLFPSSPC